MSKEGDGRRRHKGAAVNKPDIIEIWLGDQVLLRLNSSFAPMEGELINIKKTTYRVVGRSFSVDHSDDPFLSQARCNLIVEPVDTKEQP
jgi:hypothetical protein